MDSKKRTKVNKFGKTGKIVLTVLTVVAMVATLLTGAATIYAATFPKDAVKVAVTNQAEFKVTESSFASVWGMLVNGFSYATDENQADMLKNGEKKILPAENTEIDVDLKFFNQSYSSATVRSQNGEKIIEAKAAPTEYRSSDLVKVFVFATLFFASCAVSLFLLQKLFKVLSSCESPFCADFVSKLRTFGYSLLPLALFASVGETLAVRFLSGGNSSGVLIQWGILIAFAVALCLASVFNYGVQLQKESDETL